MAEDILEIKENEEARDVHAKAEWEREHGDLNKAVDLHDQAATIYKKTGKYSKCAEALAGKVIDYRHLARKSGDKSFLEMAVETAKEAVKVSEKTGVESSTLPLFGLATVLEEMGDLTGAVQNYREAIRRPLPIEHNTPAFRANMQIHLAACEYKTGGKDALVRAEEWLGKLIDSAHPDDYEKDVWVSGGHMRIAEAVRSENSELAKEHMVKAKAIKDKDPVKFHLRQEQFAELSTKI